MLIPVYIVGFIFGGIFLFAIARRVPHRRTQIVLRVIAVIAGPVFFLVAFSFSGWEVKKTYEMEWLRGQTALDYAGDHDSPAGDVNDYVVLKREVEHEHDCFVAFRSKQMAHYLEGLPKPTVKVEYRVIYDFYQARTEMIESIGDFGHDTASRMEILRSRSGGGEKSGSDPRTVSCFHW
jgi:hypothetical protein